jgi:hypothetical protein
LTTIFAMLLEWSRSLVNGTSSHLARHQDRHVSGRVRDDLVDAQRELEGLGRAGAEEDELADAEVARLSRLSGVLEVGRLPHRTFGVAPLRHGHRGRADRNAHVHPVDERSLRAAFDRGGSVVLHTHRGSDQATHAAGEWPGCWT